MAFDVIKYVSLLWFIHNLKQLKQLPFVFYSEI